MVRERDGAVSQRHRRVPKRDGWVLEEGDGSSDTHLRLILRDPRVSGMDSRVPETGPFLVLRDKWVGLDQR